MKKKPRSFRDYPGTVGWDPYEQADNISQPVRNWVSVMVVMPPGTERSGVRGGAPW